MKKTRKILLMAACAVLLVCISVGATVAYLTSTDSVTNTFTVGNIAITLDETKVDVNGKAVTPAERTDENTYKLMPGHSYIKDPTVHFEAGSEESYLFVKVENDIQAIEADYGTQKKIADQIVANGWTLLKDNIYWKKVPANTKTAAEDYLVFSGFKVADNAIVANYAPITEKDDQDKDVTVSKKITVTAYAVQADGFADAGAAWNATFGKN